MSDYANLLSHGISLNYIAFALTPNKRVPKLGESFTRRKETF
jgi:hypothetical protein